MKRSKKYVVITLIIILCLLLSIYLDGINILTKGTSESAHSFSRYNINIWELVAFYGFVITVLSFIFGVYIGLKNLNEIKNNDYERTKAKLVVELEVIGKRKIMIMRNAGQTEALINSIKWEPELVRGDFYNDIAELDKTKNETLFSSKLGKKLYPREVLKYTFIGNENIKKKLKDNKEFKLTIEWIDYKQKSNTFEYVLDFSRELIEYGASTTKSNDTSQKIEKLQENLVQVIKEHAFETRNR